MKLRILNNSIRIRIQQRELHTLLDEGAVQGAIQFSPIPSNRLVYSVNTSNEVDELDVHFDTGHISILVSTQVIREMVETERVGISSQKPLNEQDTLAILIEKDFKCLSPRTEDADAFPHPESTQGMC